MKNLGYYKFMMKQGLEPTNQFPEETTILQKDLETIGAYLHINPLPKLRVEKRTGHTLASYIKSRNLIVFYINPLTYENRRSILIHEMLHAYGFPHQKEFKSTSDSISPRLEKQIFQGIDQGITFNQIQPQPQTNAYEGFKDKFLKRE